MIEDSVENKKCKGVKKNVAKNRITHDDYRKCLYGGREQMRTMNDIKSHRHDVYTEKVNKVAMFGPG